jgi:hypothetical protein
MAYLSGSQSTASSSYVRIRQDTSGYVRMIPIRKPINVIVIPPFLRLIISGVS